MARGQLRQVILCSVVGWVLSTVTSWAIQPDVAAVADALDGKDPASRLFWFGRGIEPNTYVVSSVGALWDNFSDCDISSMDGLQDGRNL